VVFGRKQKQEETPQAPAVEAAGAPSPPTPDELICEPTGLHKLWYLERRLRDELARAPRINSTFSLAAWRLRMLPGETPPPELMDKAASLIATSLRSYDVPARIDEHRIAAILFDADYEAACTVAYRLKSTLQQQAMSLGKWQAGVATFPTDGVDGDALIQAAFRRLEEDARAA